jgi:mannose-1-phosphate guanylyltransferase/mannose-6-phosphate isomerase
VAAVQQGLQGAEEGQLVTFGVVPSAPETGYGYIRGGKKLSSGIFELAEFVEKPDAETAGRYLEAGNFYWNSGMFLLGAQSYLDALLQYQPEMHRHCCAAMAGAARDLDFLRPDADLFLACPSDSIDYAVMEHTDRGGIVPLDCGWSDIGAWSALWEVGTADTAGNVVEGDVLTHETTNSYVRSESRLVTTTGVDNLVVVETADAVLVADRNNVQGVKEYRKRTENGRPQRGDGTPACFPALGILRITWPLRRDFKSSASLCSPGKLYRCKSIFTVLSIGLW